MTFDIAAYLARMGAPALATSPREKLIALHLAHLQTVPFENLDIQLGRPLRLDPEALFEKVVQKRRGGFCFELNGLFALLLEGLGFSVRRLSAQVHDGRQFGPEFDHLALEVDLDNGPVLVDVGFGDCFLTPMQLSCSAPQRDVDGREFLLEPSGAGQVVSVRSGKKPWRPLYRFTRTPHPLEAFEAMCRFHQTSPDSNFVRRLVCTRATPEGRLVLSERALTTIRHGVRTRRELGKAESFLSVLEEQFGIRLEGSWPQGGRPARDAEVEAPRV